MAGLLAKFDFKYSSFMKFITLFAGALAATTAANIFLASDAYAVTLPSGWTQVGKKCTKSPQNSTETGTPVGSTQSYYKLSKTGTTLYGVYQGSKSSWVIKNVTLEDANAKMNSKCSVNSYQPT
jgi:hypothetical protein